MGYSWLGDSAPFITIVEQQLGQWQAQVRRLEKRASGRLKPSWDGRGCGGTRLDG
jgi:hypothetical protein